MEQWLQLENEPDELYHWFLRYRDSEPRDLDVLTAEIFTHFVKKRRLRVPRKWLDEVAGDPQLPSYQEWLASQPSSQWLNYRSELRGLVSSVREWARMWAWHERASAYDKVRLEADAEKWLNRTRAAREADWKAAEELTAHAKQLFSKIQEMGVGMEGEMSDFTEFVEVVNGISKNRRLSTIKRFHPRLADVAKTLEIASRLRSRACGETESRERIELVAASARINPVELNERELELARQFAIERRKRLAAAPEPVDVAGNVSNDGNGLVRSVPAPEPVGQQTGASSGGEDPSSHDLHAA